MKKITVLLTVLIYASTALYASEYSYRKYQHVKSFYKDIIDDAIDISLKNNIPPAAVLAISGLESGFGSGYVSQITGNILSLGAFKGDKELPSLRLPYSIKDNKVLYDPNVIKLHKKSDLIYKNRPKSLKRDYRPINVAGTKNYLHMLKYNSFLRKKAHKDCLNDFATRWIVQESKVKVFRDSKIYLNTIVKKYSKEILLKDSTNISFIKSIGGKKKSFNYRASWPKKVIFIMRKVGLVELVYEMKHNNKTFDDAWGEI